MTSTPEIREWAREQLATARAAGTPARFAALRARSKRAAEEKFGRRTSTPAA